MTLTSPKERSTKRKRLTKKYLIKSVSILLMLVLLLDLTAAYIGANTYYTVRINYLYVDGIGVIPEQCFYQCTSLTEITLPDSVTKIDVRAFGECEGLRYMYLSENITDIAPNAFEGDDDLIIRTQRGTYAAQYGNDNGIRVEYPYAYLLGDANGDSHVDVLDVTLLQRVLANVTSDPDGLIALRGCVSGEELSSIDVTSIQRCLAYVPTPYPVAERTSGWASAEVV